ncbi:MAG: ParB N-terminal domain-containing protein [Nitrososphaerales archaeon]|jgi:ParB/RepB/Spo0J family partition protein
MGEPRQIRLLKPDALQFNPWNCNTMTDEEMQSLEKSLENEGVQNMTPVMVRPLKAGGGGGNYQVVDGEHRVSVARKLGWASVPCIVAELDDQQAKRMCLALNLVHGNANPIKLFDLLFSEWDGGTGTLSTRELENAYGHLIGQSWISRVLQFRNLAAPVKDEAKRLFDSSEGESLTTKHLLVIAKIEEAEDQMKFLKAVVATGVSVATLERMVLDYQTHKGAPGKDSENEAPSSTASDHPAHPTSSDSLMKCECGSSYLINWRRKTAARLLDDGPVAKAIHVELMSQNISIPADFGVARK